MALSRDRILLGSSGVTTGASTNYTPVTGLNWAAQLGKKYHWKAVLLCTVAAGTTGIRFGPSASPTTAATYNTYFGLIGGDGTPAIDGGTAAGYVTTGSTTGGYTAPTDLVGTSVIATIEGIIVPAATQVVQLEVGPEAAAAVTIVAGYLEWEIIG
jgi:hypothetical protein